jgi:NAD(P)-dependent dehydrogenase (short-subunit alcohol dehydrogenase family)
VEIRSARPGLAGATCRGQCVGTDGLAAQVPLRHLGSAEDVARAVLFLASDDSRYILGAELVVDGGISQP